MKRMLEICCGSAADVIEAEKGGADRAELNSALCLGGLTPSIGALITAKRETKIPIMTMVRPRQGGFCYTDTEFTTAMTDAEVMLTHGADGLVFGFLHADGSLDIERCRMMAKLCGNRDRVFHRAIDVCSDWKKTLDQLIGLNFTRVLTSGRAKTALEGAETLRAMRDFACGSIEILAGGGIRLENIDAVMESTGCTQFHMSSMRTLSDPTAVNRFGIRFNAAHCPDEDSYTITDHENVARLCARIKGETI